MECYGVFQSPQLSELPYTAERTTKGFAVNSYKIGILLAACCNRQYFFVFRCRIFVTVDTAQVLPQLNLTYR